MRDLDFIDWESYDSYEINHDWRPGINEDSIHPGWKPLGNAQNKLSAIIEGNGYIIKNLYIKRDKEDIVGLIGYLDRGAEVRNLGLKGANVEGQKSVGALVGFNAGQILSSYAIGKTKGAEITGGLAGYNIGNILGSYVNGHIQGNKNVGGLVGYNRGKVMASYSTGSVEGIERVGGLVGAYYSKQTPYIGNAIKGSYSVSSVRGERDTGGIIGLFDRGGVVESYWDRERTGQETSPHGGRGLSTEEMSATSGIYPDFRTYRGAWALSEGAYPRLKSWVGSGLDNRVGTWDDRYSKNLLRGQDEDITPPVRLRNIQVNVGRSGISYGWLTPRELDYAGVFMEWEDSEGEKDIEEFGRGIMTYQRDARGEKYSYAVSWDFFDLERDYTVKLYAYDEERNLSEGVSIEVPLSRVEIPPEPINAVFHDEEGGKISVKWEAGGEEEVDGYLIFLVREDGDRSYYTTSGEDKEIELDRESNGLEVNIRNYSILVCSFRNLVSREEGTVSRREGGLRTARASSSSATMRVISSDVIAQPCIIGCSPNPSNPPSPTLNISASPSKIVAGETSTITVTGENIRGNITLTASGEEGIDPTSLPSNGGKATFTANASGSYNIVAKGEGVENEVTVEVISLTIDAPNEACAGDTIEVTIGGENLGERTITVTVGGKSKSRVGDGKINIPMPNQTGPFSIRASTGSVSASKTIKVIGADDVKITSIGFKIKDSDLNHLPSKPGKMIGIFSNETLEFKPITDPANFEGKLGELTWSGEASGEGTTNIIKFSSEGNFDVSLVRGDNTNTASVKVVNKPTGIGQEAYYILYNRFARRATASNLLPSLLHLAAAVMLGERPPTEPERWANETYANTPSLINAARHAYWIMSLKVFVDPGFAEGAGMAHEVSGADENPAYDTIVDLHNNKVAFDSIEESQVTGDNITNKRTFLQNKVRALISDGELLHHNKIGLIMKTSMTNCD